MNIYVHYQFLLRGEGKVRGLPLTLRVTSQKKMAMWSDTLPFITPSPPGPSRALNFLLWVTASTATFWEGTQWYGLPRWLSGKEPACQCRSRRRCRFDPWVRKIPWRRKWQPAPVFLPGESHGRRSLEGYSPRGHRVGHDCARMQAVISFQFFRASSSNPECEIALAVDCGDSHGKQWFALPIKADMDCQLAMHQAQCLHFASLSYLFPLSLSPFYTGGHSSTRGWGLAQGHTVCVEALAKLSDFSIPTGASISVQLCCK